MTIQIDQLRIAYKNPCRFATTANINLSTTGLTAIDGVTPVAGNRAFVKDQSAGAENGIYIAASTAWIRSRDFNAVSADSLEAGVSIFVQEGTANALNSYILTTTGTIVLDTTALTFIEDITGGSQPLDADLTALAALSTTGIVTRTAADTYLTRTITGTTNKITVTDGDGVADNPTLTVGSDIVQLDATQTLTAKTLTTPTIVSFVNATHDHQAAAGGGQLDHGLALTGLGDDDHTQYTLADGTRAFTGVVSGITPTSSANLTTKSYVDSLFSGLSWKDSVAVKDYIGTRTVVQINALSPVVGESVVSSDAGTPSAGTSDALVAGDIAEYDGTSWKKIVGQSGSFPPDGTRALVHEETFTLFSPLSDGSDEGKIAEWDGTSLTPALETSLDGWALLVNGDPSQNENKQYVYDGSVPSGTWVQFGGSGTSHSALSDLAWTSSAHTGTANRLASFGGSGEATETLVSATAAATTVPLADGAGHIDLTYIDIDDSTLEDATNVLQVKDSGITEAKLSFTFETEIIAASAFSFSATRSTFTLLGAASSTDSSVIDGFQLFKNGVNDQTRVTTTAATDEFSLAGATLSVHDDITSTGATYKIVYIAV